MEESDDKMSVESIDSGRSGSVVKPKPKKRSLIERELETNLTARVTSPVICEGNTSRYGRARRSKTDSDFCDTDKAVANALKSPRLEKSPVKSPPAYKMHATNSPVQNTQITNGNKLSTQIDNIYNVNVSLSRFTSEEKKNSPPVKKFPKIYSRQDLLQTKETEKEEAIMLIKNMFSPAKSSSKKSNNHIDIILDRSAEKYTLNSNSVKQNGYLNTSSVVKTLDFDGSKKRKSRNSRENKVHMSKSELFELEAKCVFQVGDLTWARIGTFPFWPCIVTREPGSDMFVKKKLFGLKERDVIHVTFFGDNGRRSWVLDKLLRPFLGQQEFENARNQFTPEAKKKDPRLYAAFFISDKKQSLWNASVLEAENLMREPKRLRIDIFYENLEKSRMVKIAPKGQKKLARADSDVSLSESLFDSLFSEEDGKGDDLDKTRVKRNNSLDVSEVVTACLDNMVAKSGMANIQKQSHMDRWLQKAKSNTPEKTTFKVSISVESVDEIKENKVKESKKDFKKKNIFAPRESPVSKPYKLRKSVVESQNKHNTNCITEKVELNLAREKEDKKELINDEIRNRLVTKDVSECESLQILKKDILEPKNCDLNLGQNFIVNSNKNDALEINLIIEETSATDEKEEVKLINDDSYSICNGKVTIGPNKHKKLRSHESQKICDDILQNVSHLVLKSDDDKTINTEVNIDETENHKPSNDVNIIGPDCKGDEKINIVALEKDNKVQSQKSVDDINVDVNIAKTSFNQSIIPDEDVCLQDKSLSGPDITNDSDLTDCESLSEVRLKSTPVKESQLDISKDSDLTDCESLSEVKLISTPVKESQLDISKDSDFTDCESLFGDNEKSSSTKNKLTDKNDIDVIDTENLLKIKETAKKSSQLVNSEDCILITSVYSLNREDKLGPENESVLDISKNKNFTTSDKLLACESKAIAEKYALQDQKILGQSNDLKINKELKKIQIGKELKINLSVQNCSTAEKSKMKSNKDPNKDQVPQKKAKDFVLTNDSTVGLKSDKLALNQPALEKNSQKITKLPENDYKLINETIENKTDINELNKVQNKKNMDEQEKTDCPIECLSDDDFDTISINSAISEISITENEKLAFTKGVPETLINGFHSDAYTCKVKVEPQDFDVVSMNSENDNITLKDLQLRLDAGKTVLQVTKTDSNSTLDSSGCALELINSEKDIKTENDYIDKVDTQGITDKVVRKVGKVLLQRIDIDKYLNVPLKLRKSQRLTRLRDKIEKKTIEEKHNTGSEHCTSKKFVESHMLNSLDGTLNKKEDLFNQSKDTLNQSIGTLKSEYTPSKTTVIKDKETSSADKVSTNKENSAKDIEEIDNTTINTDDAPSVNSNKNNISSTKQKKQSKNKSVIKKQSMQEPEFQLYLEVKRDRIIDEHPELTYNEIVAYLYKTWLYAESLKTDAQKTDDIESSTLIKAEKSSEDVPNKKKETEANKKSKRSTNEKKKLDPGKEHKKITDYINVSHREKPKRKVSQPFYYEDFSDIEDEIQMFEIFRKKSVTSKTDTPKTKTESEIEVKEQQHEHDSCYQIKEKVCLKTSTPDKGKIEKDPTSSTSTTTKNDVGIKSVTSKTDTPKTKTESEIEVKEQQHEHDTCYEIKEKVCLKTSTPDKGKIEKEPTSSTSTTTKKNVGITDDSNPQIETSLEETKENLNETDTSLEEYYNEEELYFEQLTQPKPNVFKGLTREKVCEICEKKSNLVKCKGCNGMFHVDCVKKKFEVADVGQVEKRGKKKKKKQRVRKHKSSADSTLESESHSDDRSQDHNASGELNESLDDFESCTIADAENFEAQLEAKMKELIEGADKNIQYDSYSSDDGLDWSDTEAGKCKIVDIKLKEKRVDPTDISDFKCKNCQKHEIPICFVCKSAVSPKNKSEIRQRCHVSHCHKYYHLECLDHWPQTQFSGGESSKQDKKVIEAITCPRHVCHTCVSDDPRGCNTRFSGDKLARCVRCPATYHTFTKCLPAGTEILTASHIICPRHYEHRPGKVPYHVNTGWCFICALGGSLICCEYCPTSFHAECLNISPPEGGYMCEDCETGRLPLYGEMVWVKLGHYRWWPGIILHPSEIPSNILAAKHSLGEFVVRFFGQYDHYWVNRGRVFPFQEGDTGRISSQKSKIDEAFTIALEHANKAFDILKNIEPNEEENLDIASSLLPPQYVRLKVNKPCGSLCGKRIEIEESSLTQCDCNPDEQDPCGPDSHCLNRMLLTECGPICRSGERCQNRAFERRQYPSLVPYRTPHRGWGLKTLEDIKAGQFVIEYVGELIDMEEFQRRMRRKHEMRDENFYFLTLDKERMIDAGPKGNLARFMNHCCEPNCETQKWTVLGDVRVGLFAIYDIPANSEVTFNYNLECAGIDKKRCMCGAKRCSGYIGAKPKPDTKDESQLKKPKLAAKRTYKKRKNAEESPSTSKTKAKRPIGRPAKPRELTEIEKDLLIIKSATSALSSDSEGSGRLSSVDVNVNSTEKVSDPEKKPLKRKRVSFSTEDKLIVFDNTSSPCVKKIKLNEVKDENEKDTVSSVGD